MIESMKNIETTKISFNILLFEKNFLFLNFLLSTINRADVFIKWVIIDNFDYVSNDFCATLDVWFDLIGVIFRIVENCSKIDHRNSVLKKKIYPRFLQFSIGKSSSRSSIFVERSNSISLRFYSL